MRPRPPVFVALSLFAVATAASNAYGQLPVRLVADASHAAPIGSGRIDGLVRDETGRPVEAVSVVAMGETVVAARSDARGRFSLVVDPGEYVLRVSRAGYISTYREAVNVRGSARLEREITLVRLAEATAPEVLRAGMGQPPASTEPASTGRAGSHSHTEAAWRLRHLPRSVLRDRNAIVVDPQDADTIGRPPTLLDRATGSPAPLANTLFTGAELTGQLNFLTTSVLDSSVGWLPETWPRSIAYFAIGSVAGSRGDWQMRGSIGGGDSRSWALLGEYQSPDGSSHALRLGISYSTQGYMPQRSDHLAAATPAARSVAGVYAYDRWTHRFVEIDYGLRLDRYDYVATPELLSPRAGGRVWLPARLFAVANASRRMIAPGADEFLPPESPGPWVPPERTFSPLFRNGPLAAEQVDHVEIGAGRQFGRGDRTAHVLVRRLRQSTRDQIATVFGLDSSSDLGHYYVASPGDVDLRAWAFELGARFAPRFDARVEYSTGVADWDRRPFTWRLRRVAPGVIHRQHDRLHDIRTVVHADIRETSTRVTFAYRVNSTFDGNRPGVPNGSGRFDLRVRQALPYQPFRGARLEVLVAARTLSRDLSADGPFFDELLTVAPPLRLMGGVQVRF